MSRIFSIFVIALLLSSNSDAWAQKTPAKGKKVTKKQAEAALANFAKTYANKNEHVRRAAIDDLGTCDHQDAVIPLIKAMSDKSLLVRDAVSPALAKQSNKEGLALMTRELAKAKQLDVKLAILEAFKTSRPKVAYPTVIKLAESKVFELRLVAAELLAVMPSEKGRSEKLLMAMTKDKEPQIRGVALDTLVALKHPAAVDVCLELMDKDKDWRVRSSAMGALRSFRVKKSITPLINAMEKEKGRLRDDAHAALVDITAVSYSPKPDVWRRWWNRAKGGFKVPTQKQIDEARKKMREAMAEYGAKDKAPPFHGIRTKSKRMMFLLDVSGSMSNKIMMATNNEAAKKAFKERYGEYETKIELAREELINNIANLEPHVKFNIVTFDSDVQPWKDRLMSASRGNKNMAFKFLSKLTPDWIDRRSQQKGKSRTNTFGALNFAFGLKKMPSKKPSKNHKVEGDTVFLMTDGMPSAGRLQDTDEMLRYFKAVNRRAKIVFHTITFGNGNSALLQPMAMWSGGQYVEISM